MIVFVQDLGKMNTKVGVIHELPLRNNQLFGQMLRKSYCICDREAATLWGERLYFGVKYLQRLLPYTIYTTFTPNLL